MIQWAKAGRDGSGAVILNKRLLELHKENGLILPVIRWLYTSNKAHIRRLKKHELIKQVDTPFQFILMTGSMDKETRFQLLKREAHFARELMRKWSTRTVDNALKKAYSSRSNEVSTLLGNGSSMYHARARMAAARKAISLATEALDSRHVRDIDGHVLNEALQIVKKDLDRVVKATFDDYATQKRMLRDRGVQVPPSANASNAQPIGKTGSFWAWHGSAMMSWHLILRTGLRNLSGTSLQQFGAAYVVFERGVREWCSSAKCARILHILTFSCFYHATQIIQEYHSYRSNTGTEPVSTLVRTPASQQDMLVTDIRIGHILNLMV